MFTIFVILFLIKVELSTSSCPWLTKEDCVCNYGSTGNNSKKLSMNCTDQDKLMFSFHVKASDLVVFCESDELDSSLFNLLPALNKTFLEGISNIKLLFCPLPERFSILTSKFPTIRSVFFDYACSFEACHIGDDFFDTDSSISSLTSKYSVLTLQPIIFKNLRLLEKFEMIHNTLDNLSSSLFQFNYELKYFILMNSTGTLVLPDKFLAKKPQLLSVTLANNGIEKVPLDIFHKSINIVEIDLSGNYISELYR